MKTSEAIFIFIIFVYVLSCIVSGVKIKDDSKAFNVFMMISIGYLITLGLTIGIISLFA